MPDYISAVVEEWGLDTFRFEAGQQLHSPTTRSGAVVLLRHELAPASQRVELIGVDISVDYAVRFSEGFAQEEVRQMGDAVTVTVGTAPGSMLVEYTPVQTQSTSSQ